MPVMYSTNPPYPDLITRNRHLLCSEFMRSFISSIYNLMYLGYRHGFPVEWATPYFNSVTNNQPWKPWHHIYSVAKAGEGSHNPQVNTIGKILLYPKIIFFLEHEDQSFPSIYRKTWKIRLTINRLGHAARRIDNLDPPNIGRYGNGNCNVGCLCTAI